MIIYMAKIDLLNIQNKDCPNCAAGLCGTKECACYGSKKAEKPIYNDDGGRQK